jgi:hypothetical protein
MSSESRRMAGAVVWIGAVIGAWNRISIPGRPTVKP